MNPFRLYYRVSDVLQEIIKNQRWLSSKKKCKEVKWYATVDSLKEFDAGACPELIIPFPNNLFFDIVAKLNSIDNIGDLFTNHSLLKAYDEVCVSVHSHMVSHFNAAYKSIYSYSKKDFLEYIKQCVDILKSVNTVYTSDETKAIYKRDIELMEISYERYKDDYYYIVAQNSSVCWYCGEKIGKTPLLSNEDDSMVYKVGTKFYKDIKPTICFKCLKEKEILKSFFKKGTKYVFVILVLLYLCFVTFLVINDPLFEFSFEGVMIFIVFTICFSSMFWGISLYLGKYLGVIIRDIHYKKKCITKRKILRKKSDCPKTIEVQNDVFFPKPYIDLTNIYHRN